jgi:HPt (histidine-containing phosphotransfer) domain-containing protein
MLMDLKYLQQMTGNDSQIMNEMIELFLNQLAEMRVEIELLLNEKKWFELSRLAHKIKSSALVMGAEQMSDEMKELELLSKDGKNPEKYPDYIARFNTMIDLIEIELKPYLDSC